MSKERFDIEETIRILGLEMRAEQADGGKDFDVACRIVLNKLKKCKEYEDLEEQNLLLRLPCKIGDKVYAITRDFVSEYTICNIEVYNEGFFFNWKCEKGIYINIRGFTHHQIGVDIFLTQPEAEEKLRELNKENEE